MRMSLIKPSLFLALMLMMAVHILSLNMFLPSLGEMANEFEVDYTSMAFAVSGYLIFSAVLLISLGPLADGLGRREVLLYCLGIFIFASIGCALATHYAVFIFFRFLQAVVVVATVIARAVVSESAPPEQAASLLGSLGMGMSLAPIFGPIFGGYIGEMAGWRASFWAFTLLGLGLWMLSWFVVPKTASARYENAGKIVREYGALMLNRQFWDYALIMIGAIGGFFVFISCVPLVASVELQLSQSQTGIGIGSITLGFFVGNFISSKLTRHFGLNRMIVFGRGLATLGIFTSFILLFLGWVEPWGLFFGVVMMGLGNGITLPSTNAAVMAVNAKLATSASGLSSGLVMFFAAIFTALAGAIIQAYPQAVVLAGILGGITFASFLVAISLRRKTPLPNGLMSSQQQPNHPE